jgi:hypothetical protein
MFRYTDPAAPWDAPALARRARVAQAASPPEAVPLGDTTEGVGLADGEAGAEVAGADDDAGAEVAGPEEDAGADVEAEAGVPAPPAGVADAHPVRTAAAATRPAPKVTAPANRSFGNGTPITNHPLIERLAAHHTMTTQGPPRLARDYPGSVRGM